MSLIIFNVYDNIISENERADLMKNEIALNAAELNSNNCTNQIQEEINHLKKIGGGILKLTSGTFKVSSLELCDNLTLVVSAGAILSFLDDPDLYPIIETRWEGHEQKIYQACLYADNCKNITLCGQGIVEGNGSKWWQEFREKNLPAARPYLLSIEHSTRIRIKELFFRNSPSWTLHPYDCNDVIVDSVTIKNPDDSPNTDGIDPESCRNMRVISCMIDVGDDCIAIKSGTEDAFENLPTENITVTNCNMLHGHGGVVLGSEMSGDIRNIVISNCIFSNTDRGIRIKTRRGRGGKVESINVNNIVMDQVLCPIVINSYYFCGEKGKEKYVWNKEKLPINEATPEISDISFSNIRARNITSCAAFIYGLPEVPIKNVSIVSSQFELSQNSEAVTPAMIADAPSYTKKGIFIENTQNCMIDSIQIQGAEKTFVNCQSNKNLKTINLE